MFASAEDRATLKSDLSAARPSLAGQAEEACLALFMLLAMPKAKNFGVWGSAPVVGPHIKSQCSS